MIFIELLLLIPLLFLILLGLIPLVGLLLFIIEEIKEAWKDFKEPLVRPDPKPFTESDEELWKDIFETQRNKQTMNYQYLQNWLSLLKKDDKVKIMKLLFNEMILFSQDRLNRQIDLYFEVSSLCEDFLNGHPNIQDSYYTFEEVEHHGD